MGRYDTEESPDLEPADEGTAKRPGADKIWRDLEASRDAKSTVLKHADESLLFLEGRQWIRWDRKRSEYVDVPPPEKRPRVTINLLLGPYRNLLSNLTVDWPGVTCMPTAESDEDIVKSRAAAALLQLYWQNAGLEYVYLALMEWVVSTGTAALHTFWDGDKSTPVTEVVSLYDLFPEANVDDERNMNWMAVRRAIRRGDLAEAHPKKKEKIDALPCLDVTDESYRDEESEYTAYDGDAEATDNEDDRIEVFDVYWRDGRHVKIAKGLVLERNDTGLDRIPIQVVRYHHLPGAFWGVSAPKPALEIQYCYNRMRSQIIELIDKFSNPVWKRPIGSRTPVDEFHSGPGNVINYNPNLPEPKREAAPPLPAHVMAGPPTLAAEIQDAFLVHSTTMGKRAAGINAAVSMQELRENDLNQLTPVKKESEHSLQDCCKCVLLLYQEHWEEAGKTVAILDGPGEVMFREIPQTLFDGPVPEVFVQTGSMFRSDAAARDQAIYMQLQLGIITPEEASHLLSSKARVGDGFKRVMMMRHCLDMLEVAKAAEEIFQTRGAPPTIMVFPDEAEMVVEVWGNYMRTLGYYKLPKAAQDLIYEVYVDASTMGLPIEARLQARELMAHPLQPMSPPAMGPPAPGQQGTPMNPATAGMPPPSKMPSAGPAGGLAAAGMPGTPGKMDSMAPSAETLGMQGRPWGGGG